jgi:hypothetical protein
VAWQATVADIPWAASDFIHYASTIASHGHLRLMQWYASRYSLQTSDVAYMLEKSCFHGHLAVAQWAAARYRRTQAVGRIGPIMRIASVNGHAPVVRRLVTRYTRRRTLSTTVTAETHITIPEKQTRPVATSK